MAQMAGGEARQHGRSPGRAEVDEAQGDLEVVGGGGPIANWKSPALWVGIAVLAAFIPLVIWTFAKRADPNWDHIVYIYGSVEAIVFAAGGAIFGTQVQRQQTERAQQQGDKERARADSAQSEAQGHAVRAARGESLAAAVRAAARGDANGLAGGLAAMQGAEPVEGSSVLHQLAAIADSILPEV